MGSKVIIPNGILIFCERKIIPKFTIPRLVHNCKSSHIYLFLEKMFDEHMNYGDLEYSNS